MFKIKPRLAVWSIVGLLALPLLAAAQESTVGKTVAKAVDSAITQAFPGVKVTAMHPSGVGGFVEVQVNGSTTAYASDDGKYLFIGSLYQLDGDKGAVDLTEKRLEGVRKTELARVKPNTMVTYAAKGKQKAQLYVFTDTECPFCKRFHEGMQAMNEMGVTVHYLAFPRAGVNSPVGQEMSAVWCAKDPQAAMTEAKLGKGSGVPEQNALCASPVASEYQLGARLGVTGTPAVFTEDGVQIGGYLPPAKLAQVLGLDG